MRSGLIQILVGAIVAYFIIVKFFSNDKDFGNLALGTQTVMYQAFDDTNFLHLVRLDDTLERNLISGWKLRGQKDVCMLLGNSQMHSINQIENGQTTYVGLLHNRYEDSVDVLGYSCPNASLQDYYLTLCYWSERLPVKYAVVPLFLDDMREEGIRHEFLSALVNSRYQLSDTTRDINNKINTDLRKAWNEQGGSSANNAIRMSEAETSVDVVEEKTPQDKTEAYLNKELDSVSKVWRNRPNVRGELFNSLYKLRNTVLGISASTVREMIPQRYETNMEALIALLDYSKAHDIKLLIYIPPIRSDAPLPYNLDDYKKYKEKVAALAIEYPNVSFENFEDAIPGELWGYKEATSYFVDKEIDYMHFQYKGHQILADKLSHSINLMFR